MFIDDEDAASVLRERALSLSLQYNFVTELTSLIVVEEGAGNFTLDGDSANEGSDYEDDFFGPDINSAADGGGTFNSSQLAPQLLLGHLMVLLCLSPLFA